MDPLVLGSDLYDVHIHTIIEVIGGYTCYLLLCFLDAQHLYNSTLPLFMSFSKEDLMNHMKGRRGHLTVNYVLSKVFSFMNRKL